MKTEKKYRILEIGTGIRFPVYECLLEKRLKQPNKSLPSYTGMDINPETIKRAKIILKNSDKFPNFSFVCADAISPLPFEDECFDTVYCNMLTLKGSNYLRKTNESYPNLLKEVKRILKLNGNFYISADHTFFTTSEVDYTKLQQTLKSIFGYILELDPVNSLKPYSCWSMFSEFCAICKKR